MNKLELKEIILEEKNMYVRSNYYSKKFAHQKRYMIWKYLSYFRKAQYYKEKVENEFGLKKLYARIKYKLYVRQKNIYGEKCGVEIANDCKLGRRLDIWHGGVVINADIGDDCIIRGNNVLGNKGLVKFDGMPTLGNGVDVGVGAVLLGNLLIADRCEIGANAVVTKSFTEPGTIIVGVPGRILERK